MSCITAMQYFKGEGKQKLISQSYRISKNFFFFFLIYTFCQGSTYRAYWGPVESYHWLEAVMSSSLIVPSCIPKG